ncbi:transaldolase family protein [uncultured Sphaerochaeta sp.]|uniref:transaldolase family protein n=1 Tax=uncultured Sphaerochaeta sp. TaxID=886478 RepID=UPI0029CA22C7|nr:transaldolase family protein [uncultured Sphaerochaeta sp.]
MDYFKRVAALTPTKFWVNNVSREEAQLGIAAGASGCTQNPSYVWKMLNHPEEKEYATSLLREIMQETDDDNQVICILQRKLIKGVSDIFMDVYNRTHGEAGYVSIQGDPIHEEDYQVILDEARLNREMNPNIMIKIPATESGLKALEILLCEGTPINATEVMGVDQVIALGEIYQRVFEQTGKRPVMYFSLITGIFNEWLRGDVKEKGIDINADVLHQAGMVIAKKVYQLNHDRNYKMGFISGGARTLDDFYEMVGGDVCVTMNWKGSCDELIKENKPVISRLFNPVQPMVLDQLQNKLPQFNQAFQEGGLSVDEFEHYGPVMYFRDSFIRSWESAVEMVASLR